MTKGWHKKQIRVELGHPAGTSITLRHSLRHIMTRFRPCIDLHHGTVKQIVGSTLTDGPHLPTTNFVSDRPASWFADLYRTDGLTGGHVIKLGEGNDEAARNALASWKGGLQLGGGITAANAAEWIQAGASHVIVTSYLFSSDGTFIESRLRELVAEVGSKHLVIDLSCRKNQSGWHVAMNRWQTPTTLPVTTQTLDLLAEYCDEFLIHAADVEGLCNGIDKELVALLGSWKRRPVTYAGGICRIEDFDLIDDLSGGFVDATAGSALDLFGGSLISYQELVAREHMHKHP